MISGRTVRCDCCHRQAELVTGREVYRGHRPDLHAKYFWQCRPCNARVGCHPGTQKPLGGLAKPELRLARSRAHAVFDPIWREGTMRRAAAYRWLARKLNRKEIHIGESDEIMCARIIAICQEAALKPKKQSKKQKKAAA